MTPRGLHEHPELRLRRIRVDHAAGAESRGALNLAASIAIVARAKLTVQTVVDDRRLPFWSSGLAKAGLEEWDEAISAEVGRRRDEARAVAQAIGGRARTDLKRGRPADALRVLSQQVDLLVIGSRRWGPGARMPLGSTGEALPQDAASSVLVVPRPAA
jgi:nucleotide-binding universal stress UspA family protein